MKNNCTEEKKKTPTRTGAIPNVKIFQKSNFATTYKMAINMLTADIANPDSVANLKGILE